MPWLEILVSAFYMQFLTLMPAEYELLLLALLPGPPSAPPPLPPHVFPTSERVMIPQVLELTFK